MMHKIIGSILVILACTGIGFARGHDLQIHLKELEELKRIFLWIRSEIQYNKIPFSEVFWKIENKTSGNFKLWLQTLADSLEKRDKHTFQELWESSITKCLKETLLSKEERKELKDIGTGLAYIETIEVYLEQLEIRIQRAREDTTSKQKIYQSMGVMSGIFLIILLL